MGAGGIVGEAHLPAYQKAGWSLHGIVDLRIEKARQLADARIVSTPRRSSIPNTGSAAKTGKEGDFFEGSAPRVFDSEDDAADTIKSGLIDR